MNPETNELKIQCLSNSPDNTVDASSTQEMQIFEIQSWVAKTHANAFSTVPTLKACNSPYMQYYLKRFFCFAILGSYIFISDQNVKVKCNRNRNCIFSFPWKSQGSLIGSFLLCFTYPSQLPLQTDTYIDELVEIFLKLPVKTVQVHSIIGTTLVRLICL